MSDLVGFVYSGPRYGRVPAVHARNPAISPAARALLAIIATYDGERGAFMAMATMAEHLGRTTRWVRKLLRELEEHGALVVIAEATSTHPRVYSIAWPVDNGGKQASGGEVEFRPGGKQSSPKQTIEQTNSIPNDRIGPPPGWREHVESL